MSYDSHIHLDRGNGKGSRALVYFHMCNDAHIDSITYDLYSITLFAYSRELEDES